MHTLSMAAQPSSGDDQNVSVDARIAQLRGEFGLLSTTDLAALIEIDERTLSVWRCQKRGPDFVKLGRAVFYRKDDVAVWIGLNTVPTDRAA
jgi:hypothetical protein